MRAMTFILSGLLLMTAQAAEAAETTATSRKVPLISRDVYLEEK